jgi:hypothetical protein
LFRVLCHHSVCFFIGQASWVIAAEVWVVKRGLIRTDLNYKVALCQFLPEVYHITTIADRDSFLVCLGLLDSLNHLIEISVFLIEVALLMTLVKWLGVDLGYETYTSTDSCGLGLCAGHPS